MKVAALGYEVRPRCFRARRKGHRRHGRELKRRAVIAWKRDGPDGRLLLQPLGHRGGVGSENVIGRRQRRPALDRRDPLSRRHNIRKIA